MSKNTHETDATGGLKGFLARRREGLMHGVFAVAACVSIICVILICVFLFGNAIPGSYTHLDVYKRQGRGLVHEVV